LISLLQSNGYKYSKQRYKTFEKTYTLPTIATENGNLISREMVISSLGLAQYCLVLIHGSPDAAVSCFFANAHSLASPIFMPDNQ
jgi:hypothetical protein